MDLQYFMRQFRAKSEGIRETFKSGFKATKAAFLESKRSLCTFRILIFESATINWTDFLRAYTINPYEERNFNYVREKTT